MLSVFTILADATLVLHCCINAITHRCLFLLMPINPPRHTTQSSRSLRARLMALLLLVAQLTSLLIVPLHAVAHAQAAHAPAAVVSGSSALSILSGLFGHEQGLGCDEWSAAFSLDSHSGCGAAALVATLPSAADIFGVLPTAPPAVSFGHFLARAPPHN